MECSETSVLHEKVASGWEIADRSLTTSGRRMNISFQAKTFLSWPMFLVWRSARNTVQMENTRCTFEKYFWIVRGISLGLQFFWSFSNFWWGVHWSLHAEQNHFNPFHRHSCENLGPHKVINSRITPPSAVLASKSVFDALSSNHRSDALLYGHNYTVNMAGCQVTPGSLWELQNMEQRGGWSWAKEASMIGSSSTTERKTEMLD